MATLTEAQILAQIALVQAALDALTSRKVKRYRIGERSFEFYDLPALMKLLEYYQGLIESIPVEEVTVYDDTDV